VAAPDRVFAPPDIKSALYGAAAAALLIRQRTQGLHVPDFWSSQSHSTIRTQHGVIPFVPFQWQRDFVEGLTPKEMVLKSRDVGSSEICVRYFCWLMLKEGGNILIKADKHDNAKNLIAIAKHYLTSLPAGERPTLTKDNETELELAGIGTIKAMAQGGGRSERCKYLLMTERAFWESPDIELAAISGALVAGGYEVIESTANGFNEYHSLWVDDQNGYRKTFTGRHDNPTHDSQWWESKRSQFAANPSKLLQEYPETADQAFVASGNCVFEVEKVREMQRYCKPPIDTRLNGTLKVWERPRVGRRYVAGADVAEGIDVGNNRLDYSGVAIYDWQTAAHVADLHGQWDLGTFAGMVDTIGREYNNAFLGVERNNHGHAVLLKLKDLEYPSLYYHTELDEDIKTGKRSNKRVAGWPTTSTTKPVMIDTLASMIASGGMCSYDQAFWDECLSFVRHGDGKTGAQQGTHDDRVIKHMIALMMRDRMPAPQGHGIMTGQRVKFER
jgi:hypothetical protein